jgi:hypothetical protein
MVGRRVRCARLGFTPPCLAKALAALAGCSLLGVLLATEPATNDAITKADLKTINEELLPAIRLGDLVAIVRSGTALASRMKPDDRPAVDRLLTENGLPALADLVTDARLKVIELGLVKSPAFATPQEALILLPTLKTRIEKVLASGNAHPAFQNSAPATLDEFEKLLWSMHVFTNQSASAARFCDFAQELKGTAEKLKAKAKGNDATAVLQTDWSRIKADLAWLRERFVQRDRDLRVARLALADRILTESRDVGERLRAALAVDMDGEGVPASLAKDSQVSAEVRQKVADTVAHARKAAGPELLQKSRLLFTGLHWWLRGRYGMGTAGGGLLKDTTALTSPEAMFGLLMPIQPPIPTPSAVREPVPLVDRRHHYLWQFETRELVGNRIKNSTSQQQFAPIATSVTTTKYFY